METFLIWAIGFILRVFKTIFDGFGIRIIVWYLWLRYLWRVLNGDASWTQLVIFWNLNVIIFSWFYFEKLWVRLVFSAEHFPGIIIYQIVSGIQKITPFYYAIWTLF
jgi:hypothetical protein